jgi:hypothetical protein
LTIAVMRGVLHGDVVYGDNLHDLVSGVRTLLRLCLLLVTTTGHCHTLHDRKNYIIAYSSCFINSFLS